MDMDTKLFLENMQKQMFEKLDSVDKRLDSVDKRLDSMDKRFDLLESQVKENTQILKALEENIKITRAEQEKLTYKLSEIEGSLKSTKTDLSTIEAVTAKNWNDIVHLKAVK